MYISNELIKSFMNLNYNGTVITINRLDGYKDINFRLQIVDNNSDETSGYDTVILKTLSPESSYIINLQHKMMIYLFEKGIDTCRPVMTAEGSTFCKINVSESPGEDALIETVACVLTYIPGITMRCADHPVYLMEDAGRLAGKVDRLLKQFEPDDLQDIDTLWELSRAPEVEAYLDKYCSKEVRNLGLDVINAFRKYIAPVLHSFQKGYIHGDINDCNIIVSHGSSDAKAYTISGLIDYGDACVSFYIYEIATLMADMMSACRKKTDPFEVGRLVLKGYRQEFELNPVEIKYLRLVICIRMVQYYALGSEVAENDPDNEYARLDNDDYIHVCKFLWNVSDEQFNHEVLGLLT